MLQWCGAESLPKRALYAFAGFPRLSFAASPVARFRGFTMRRRHLSKLLFVALLVCWVSTCSPVAIAQEADEPAEKVPEKPFAVVSVAGIERMLGALDFSFEAADRPEASEALTGFLERAGDLKGIDHRQGFGIMIYLSGIMPQPVGFAPVDKIEDMMKTVELGPFTTKKIDAENYELKGTGGSVFVKLVGRYAFFSNQQERLDREFPDPAPITQRLAKQYDIAAMVDLNSLPEDQKNLLATLLRGSADANLQRRDGETEAAHRIRKAIGENHAALLEQVLRQAREVTLGWKLSAERRQAALELSVIAYRGTELETLLTELNATRTQFTNFLKGDAPLTFASTWKLDKRGKTLFDEIVQALAGTIPSATEANEDDPIQQMFRAARADVESGGLDFAIRFLGEPKGPFVLVGGLKVTDGRAMEAGLAELCTYLLETGKVDDIEVDVDKYQGIRVHRVDLISRDNDNDRIYGGKPSLYMGVDDKTLWIAVGGDEALPVLYEQIDKLAEPADKAVPGVPMQFVINMSDWMSLGEENDRRNRVGRTFQEAFTRENSTMRIELRSIENGARLRLEWNEGFIRFVGMMLARRFTRD